MLRPSDREGTGNTEALASVSLVPVQPMGPPQSRNRAVRFLFGNACSSVALRQGVSRLCLCQAAKLLRGLATDLAPNDPLGDQSAFEQLICDWRDNTIEESLPHLRGW